MEDAKDREVVGNGRVARLANGSLDVKIFTSPIAEGVKPPSERKLKEMVGKTARFDGEEVGVIKVAWLETIGGKVKLIVEIES